MSIYVIYTAHLEWAMLTEILSCNRGSLGKQDFHSHSSKPNQVTHIVIEIIAIMYKSSYPKEFWDNLVTTQNS